MSSNKTPNLNLHSWLGKDMILRSEFVDNFNKIDAKFNASNGHSHDGSPGSGGKLAATSVDYTSEKNVKEALDELFQSANRYIKSIADTIGEPFNENGNEYYNNVDYYTRESIKIKDIIRRAIGNKHGESPGDDTIADLEQRILNIPYNLEPQGSADASDVAIGKTFLNRTASLLTGTREIKDNQLYTPKSVVFNVPNAIHTNSVIKGEPKLLPENIKKDVTIYGVTGSYVPIPGYNSGDNVPYYKVIDSYVSSFEGIILGNHTAMCPRNFVWTAIKNSSSRYQVVNRTFTDQQFYFSPHSDIKSMTIDFNGFYFLTSDMIYCFDYITLSHKWGITLSSIIPAGDTVVNVFTNHIGEVIVISQNGRIFVLNYENGSLTDTYKIKDEYTHPVTINKASQRFSCDDIILVDDRNKLSFYIDSDINNDNNTRVLYKSKSLDIVDIMTTDYKTSYVLTRQYGTNANTKGVMMYIYDYDYGKATSSTVALEVGRFFVNTQPEKIYQIEGMKFLLVGPKEVIIYDAINDYVVFREEVDIDMNTLTVDNEECIYFKKPTGASGRLLLTTGPKIVVYNPSISSKKINQKDVKDVSIAIDKVY